jgi:DNA-binding transcriptional MerR regulator
MADSLDISEVARRTGLSSRALRFYESKGLVRPLRGASGRRHYGPVELERLHQIIALKRAGLSLRSIARVVARGPVDLADLIETQIDAAAAQIARLQAMRSLLRSVKGQIERQEAIDIATLCALIREGEEAAACEAEAWAAVHARYFDDEARADLHAKFADWTDGLDPEIYSAQWADLITRIRAALPMDPADPAALPLVRAWFTLLTPFSAVATPAMWEGTRAMYNDVDQWREEGRVDPGFDGEIWRFISAATEAARARGDDIGPVPAWMTTERENAP